MAGVFAALIILEPRIGMLATLDRFMRDDEAALSIRPEIAGAVKGILDRWLPHWDRTRISQAVLGRRYLVNHGPARCARRPHSWVFDPAILH